MKPTNLQSANPTECAQHGLYPLVPMVKQTDTGSTISNHRKSRERAPTAVLPCHPARAPISAGFALDERYVQDEGKTVIQPLPDVVGDIDMLLMRPRFSVSHT